MDKARFFQLLQPAIKYFEKEMDAEILDVYWKELGGYTEAKLQRAVQGAMAGGKFFPKIAELRKRIIGSEEVPEQKGVTADSDADYVRHHMAAERLFDALLDGLPEPERKDLFRFDIRKMAMTAVDMHAAMIEDGMSPRTARSCCYSSISQWCRSAYTSGKRMAA